MPEEPFQFLVGIDWAAESHRICVIDRDRQVLEEKQIEHSGRGISQLIELLLKRSGDRPEQVAVGIETPRGADHPAERQETPGRHAPELQ